MRELHDNELLALARTGERSALGELARRYAPELRAFLKRAGASPAFADDIAQDAFIIAFERLETYRGEGSFAGWLKRIAVRLYVKRWRCESRLTLFAQAPLDSGPTVDDAHDDAIDLAQALQRLSAAERLCVSLCHGAGWSHSEISAQLGVPIGTVKSHVKRGLDKLKLALNVATSPEGRTP